MSRRAFTWLDVFSAHPLAGNGLAVVHDADGIDDHTMLGLAREMRLSETSFIQSADAEGADYRNRIFMPTREIPFAGHPSLGAAVAVAHVRGEREVSYVQQTQAGLQPVDVRLDGDHATVSMVQEPATFGPELEPGEALRALGLSAEDADRSLPEQIVSTGVPQVLACVRDPAVLAHVRPDYDALGALIDRHGAVVAYLAHVDPASGHVLARGFVGSAAVGEDPATGSAAGPLCAHVAARTGCERIQILQGVEMGRPSVLRCAVEGDRVRVGGDAVVLLEGTLNLARTPLDT